ncbi:MAG: OadG family protein [Desulfobacterales bacterium]|nr:OadG family protein [Desulfobacterales bacterium]
MYGLQAISANNGWAMALVGALIVISGLGVLSFIISQLHKVVALLDKSPSPDMTQTPLDDTQRALAIPDHMPDDVHQVAAFYRTLTDQMESPFEIQRLYALSVENNFPHPHLTLRALREAGLMIPAGEGRFTWSN